MNLFAPHTDIHAFLNGGTITMTRNPRDRKVIANNCRKLLVGVGLFLFFFVPLSAIIFYGGACIAAVIGLLNFTPDLGTAFILLALIAVSVVFPYLECVKLHRRLFPAPSGKSSAGGKVSQIKHTSMTCPWGFQLESFGLAARLCSSDSSASDQSPIGGSIGSGEGLNATNVSV
jgi:hypothetical protein